MQDGYLELIHRSLVRLVLKDLRQAAKTEQNEEEKQAINETAVLSNPAHLSTVLLEACDTRSEVRQYCRVSELCRNQSSMKTRAAIFSAECLVECEAEQQSKVKGMHFSTGANAMTNFLLCTAAIYAITLSAEQSLMLSDTSKSRMRTQRGEALLLMQPRCS